MSTFAILSIMFGILGFIVGDILVYKGFGSLDFWDAILFGGLSACVGVLIGLLVMLVGVAIAF